MKEDRIIFHVDVNNAFLSWTAVKMLENGSKVDIRNIPSVIAGDEEKRHGIVLAKSPVAKKLGIVSAETLYSARKKCKNLKTYPCDFDYYKKKSYELFEYLYNYTPEIEVFSIDECYMDMTNTKILYKDYEALAYKIKDDIYKKFSYTVNVGVANNKLCAKMASDFEKPNKVHTLYNKEVKSKLWPLDISDLFMIGKQSVVKLREFGINTVEDLANTDIKFLKKKFKSYGILIWEYANGQDDSKVISEVYNLKSKSLSETLEKDIDDRETLKRILLRQSSKLGRMLRKNRQFTSLITIIIKSYDFCLYSKQRKLINPINSDIDIYKEISKLFDETWNRERVRNIGIRIGMFTDDCYEQMSIFENKTINKIDPTIDKIKDKYGESSIINASILLENKKENL